MGAMSGWFKDHLGVFEGLGLLVLSLLVASFIRRLAFGRLKKAKVDPQVTLLLVRLISLAIVLLGVVLFVSFALGNPTLVFGGFGFFALAFSLAFQDILKNFIAGIFLLLERPFRIGDEITVDNHTGVVDNVEMRTTTLRTAEGEEVLIPNSLVYTGTIINRTRHPTRLFTLTAKLPAGASFDGVAERVREELQGRPDLARDPAPQVGVQPNIDGGPTLEVRYWLDYRKHDPLAVQAAIGQQVYRAIQSPASRADGSESAGSIKT